MLRIIGIGSLLALCGGCVAVAADPEPLSQGVIEGTVILGVEPVAYAHVEAFPVDFESGESERTPVAATDADGSGRFRLDMGATFGTVRLVATGGETHEHWDPAVLTIAGDAELSAVIPRYLPGIPRDVVISPFTTLAAALARGRLAAGRERSFRDAALRAHELMNEHLDTMGPALGIDILETQPADVRRTATEWNAGVAHGLALAGLSTLAGRIAEETPDSIAAVNTITLTATLAEDARADAIFDGNGGDLTIGVCIPSPGCTGPDCQLCQLDASTLRRDLAESLLFWFVPSEHNGTGRDFMDVAQLALGMAENMSEMFGPGDLAPLDPDAPMIIMQPSEIRDERGDAITFNAFAEPMHEPTGPAIDLNIDGQCPTVYKHVNRMDDPSQNPLRWRLSVTDAGAGVKLIEYQVRELFSGAWLTEWAPVGPVAPGVSEYEIVLLRRDIPALATMQGMFEIQIRARDWFENVTPVVSRCWQHVPLAAPLRVLPAVEATGPGSLHAVSIDPDTYDLSMLINATTEREIMWFEVENGTDEPVYVTFDYAQPSAEYDLTWQRSNIELSSGPAPAGCTITLDGTCPELWPAEYQSDGAVLINQPLPGNAWNLRVLDVTTSVPVAVDVCEGCDANEYQLGARLDMTRPRRYRIALVINDLSTLAPKHPLEEIEQYDDVELGPSILPGLFITGKRYGTIFKCKQPWMGACQVAATYRHYRAIRSAALRVSTATITGRVAPAANITPITPTAQPATFGVPSTIPNFTWWVDELALPDADPP